MVEKSPEQIALEVAEKAKAKEAREKYLAEVKAALNAAATDPNVKIVLRHVMNLCGYQTNPAVIGTNSDLQVSSTVYNVGRQSPWHDLRKLMSAEAKNAVERSE